VPRGGRGGGRGAGGGGGHVRRRGAAAAARRRPADAPAQAARAETHLLARCLMAVLEHADPPIGAGFHNDDGWGDWVEPAGRNRQLRRGPRRDIPHWNRLDWQADLAAWAARQSPPLRRGHLAWLGSYVRAGNYAPDLPGGQAGRELPALTPAQAMRRRDEGVGVGLNTILALWPGAAAVRAFAGAGAGELIDPEDDAEAVAAARSAGCGGGSGRAAGQAQRRGRSARRAVGHGAASGGRGVARGAGQDEAGGGGGRAGRRGVGCTSRWRQWRQGGRGRLCREGETASC
jgi:hypothetical protein